MEKLARTSCTLIIPYLYLTYLTGKEYHILSINLAYPHH